MPTSPPETTAPKPVAPRARWMAAQRLAAGDELEQAAGFAGVEVEALRQLLDEDPGFARQCQAEERVNALPLAGRMERLQLMAWQAAERALAETRVSTVNLFLRGVLAPGRQDADDERGSSTPSATPTPPSTRNGSPGSRSRSSSRSSCRRRTGRRSGT